MQALSDFKLYHYPKLRVLDCIADFGVPKPTEWQRIGNQIDAAFIFARADFVTCCEVVIVLVWLAASVT